MRTCSMFPTCDPDPQELDSSLASDSSSFKELPLHGLEKDRPPPHRQNQPPTHPQTGAPCAVHNRNGYVRGVLLSHPGVCGFVHHDQASPSPSVLARVGVEAELAPRGV